MASGCSIITSDVGEISSTVDKDCAIILNEITIENVAKSIVKLCTEYQLRKEMGMNGYRKVQTFFSTEVYLSNWLNILNTLNNKK
jgi:glycosyltransferase involved in cell wall biosynthesis